jgi:hypothetical protein
MNNLSVGYYVQQECTAISDAVVLPCNEFPASISSIAAYRPQQISGDYGKQSMCVWDCDAGYYKGGSNGITTCVRCGSKPLNAEYVESCAFECNPGTYLRYTTLPGDTFADGPCISASCPDDTSTCPGLTIPQCKRTSTSPCEKAFYKMDHIVDGIAGYTSSQYSAIASAHQGSILYVGINSAIYSVSTFASSQFDGSKMQLIAGAAGQGSIRKDAALGVDARFTLVTFMKTSLDDRIIYVLDKLETEPPRGWLRKIDVSTPNFAVTTLSSTAGSGGVCANDTFMSPRSMDIHKSTGNLLIVDSQCETIHTYIPSTNTFLLTAGIVILIVLLLFFLPVSHIFFCTLQEGSI